VDLNLVLGALLVIAIIAMALLWRFYRRSEDARRRLAERSDALALASERNHDDLARRIDRLQALGRVLAGVTHDLNSALSVVVMNLDVMQQDPALGERHGRRIENMMKAMQKATNLTRHLLNLSHHQKPQTDVVCLADILPSHIELLQSALGKNIEIEMRAPQNLWPTHIDVPAFETATLHLALAMAGAASVERLVIELKNSTQGAVGRGCGKGIEGGEHVLLVMTSVGSGVVAGVSQDAMPANDFFGPIRGIETVERFAAHCGGRLALEQESGTAMRATLYLPRCRETTAV
jgi:K+-sensing histidine kinase KdpD